MDPGRQTFRRNRRSNEELTRLEAHFRNAYIQKGLEAQLAEKEVERLAEETREKLAGQLIAVEQGKAAEANEKRALEMSHRRMVHRQILEEQIMAKREIKAVEEAAARDERRRLVEVDELMDKVHELAKQKRRDYKAKRSRRERLLFEEIREIKRVLEEEKEKLVAQRELLYLQEVERRSRELTELRAEQARRREQLIEEVARLYNETYWDRHERELVIGDLVAEEIRHEAMIEEREQELKRKAQRDELARDLMDQMLYTVECEARAREKDRVFIEQVMTKLLVESTRLASLTEAARKRQQQEYKADLEKLIAERKRMREEAVRHARMELNETRKNEEAERQRIKVERLRLIEEHAGNIAAYLRDGVLSEDEEKIVKQLLSKCKNQHRDN